MRRSTKQFFEIVAPTQEPSRLVLTRCSVTKSLKSFYGICDPRQWSSGCFCLIVVCLWIGIQTKWHYSLLSSKLRTLDADHSHARVLHHAGTITRLGHIALLGDPSGWPFLLAEEMPGWLLIFSSSFRASSSWREREPVKSKKESKKCPKIRKNVILRAWWDHATKGDLSKPDHP